MMVDGVSWQVGYGFQGGLVAFPDSTNAHIHLVSARAEGFPLLGSNSSGRGNGIEYG